MRVEPYEPRAEKAVRAFLETRPEATFFHDPLWGRLVEREFGHPVRSLVARRGAEVVGWLPLHDVRAPLFGGRQWVSAAFGVYGGIVASDAEASAALLEEAWRRARGVGARRLELRHLIPPEGLPDDLAKTDLYCTFLRDLPEDPDACLGLIPRKSRASARQARDKHGLRFVERDDVDTFHALFVLNKRRLGSPVFRKRWFATLRSAFGERVRIHFVVREDRPIAGVMSFLHREVWNPYYSGSVPGTERLGSMNFVYWRLMEQAAREGFRRFDFGRSRRDSGAAAFKRNMGFEETPLAYVYRLVPGVGLPDANPSNPRFDLVRRAWSRLPLWAVRRIGPTLVRQLP